MKAIVYGLIVMLLLSGLGTGLAGLATAKAQKSDTRYPDQLAYRADVALKGSEDQSMDSPPFSVGSEYPMGSVIWQYQISGGDDDSPKSILSRPDINHDGVDDVLVASEDDYVRCFSGAAIGQGQVLWSAEIYAGSVYNEYGLSVIHDVNGDGVDDVVVGAAWGARLIRCLSGADGTTIWTHDTHEYGDGGWVYQVDATYDYNGDGVSDVLAVTGDDGSGTGPNRVYCLDGSTGASLWEHPLGGPGFTVIGVPDFTGDGLPDVVAGCSDAGESTGYAKGLNGVSGTQVWSFTVASSSAVWSLCTISDVNGDGIGDVAVGDFDGHVFGLNAATGVQVFMHTVGSGAIITHVTRLTDVNGDGFDDVVVGHSSQAQVQVLDGHTGDVLWSHSVADQPWNVARASDISGDDIDDVFVGTLYSSNYVYFLSGVDGSELTAPISYGEALDALAAIPDVVGDSSMELMAGGRNGKVTCYSGGANIQEHLFANFTADPRSGYSPLLVQFTDTSTAINTTITAWQWDFNNDGTIDSTTQNPQWTYTAVGNYTVSLKVSNGQLSNTKTKKGYITVQPTQQTLHIGDITGGLLKVRVQLSNNGSVPIDTIQWNITIKGDRVLSRPWDSGTIPSLAAGDTTLITCKPVFGFGWILIKVTATAHGFDKATTTVQGFLLVCFVLTR